MRTELIYNNLYQEQQNVQEAIETHNHKLALTVTKQLNAIQKIARSVAQKRYGTMWPLLKPEDYGQNFKWAAKNFKIVQLKPSSIVIENVQNKKGNFILKPDLIHVNASLLSLSTRDIAKQVRASINEVISKRKETETLKTVADKKKRLIQLKSEMKKLDNELKSLNATE